jgi:excisionase family DNA binding protein
MIDKNFYSIAEVAEILDVDVRTIKRMIKDGKLPALKLGSKITRINKYDIPSFARDRVDEALPRPDDKI